MSLKARVSKWKEYFTTGIWEQSLHGLSKTKVSGILIMRVLLASGHGFIKDRAAIRASALTFYSLLSFVPVLAVAFGIAKGFGLEGLLEKEIKKTFAGQEEIMEQLIAFSHTSLENTKGGLIAGISVIFLIWSVIKLLNHIESAFNAVWNIDKPRPFLRKITEYTTMILVGPLFIILSSAGAILAEALHNQLSGVGLLFEGNTALLEMALKLISVVLMWVLFTAIYAIMPNKTIKFKPALIAGIVGGTAFSILQSGYVYFQVAMSSYNAVYGSFAALPLFLIWLQVSWILILYGAEISFAVNYARNYKPWDDTLRLSSRKKRILALTVLRQIAERFEKGESAQTVSQIANTILLPDRQVILAIKLLQKAELIKQVEEKKMRTYLPSKSTNLLTIEHAILALDKAGDNGLSDRIPSLKTFEKVLNEQDDILLRDATNQVVTEVK